MTMAKGKILAISLLATCFILVLRLLWDLTMRPWPVISPCRLEPVVGLDFSQDSVSATAVSLYNFAEY